MTSDSCTITGMHLTVCQGTMLPEQSSFNTNSLVDILQTFWETEAVGIKERDSVESSSELFLSNVKFHDGKYEVAYLGLERRVKFLNTTICVSTILSTCRGD